MGSVPTSARHRTEPVAARVLRAAGRLALALSLAGCASAPARVALTGDLPALKAAIEQANRQEALGSGRLEELASAVLRRELVSLTAPSDEFPSVALCAREIRPVLEDVAASQSDYAADAALALLDAGLSAPTPGADNPLGAAAVEARRAIGARAGARRRALMLHGEAEVRRAALAAAADGADAGDVPALAEAARLEPDAAARAIAIRALGRIGGAPSVSALADLYPAASPEARREIIRAWASPRSFAAGGREELEDLTAGSAGEPAVLAAVELERLAPQASSLAAAALVKAIEGPAREVRLLALELSPWSEPDVRAAILAAQKHKEADTRVVALLRAAEEGGLDAAGSHELEGLASDTLTPVGAVARAALAELGKRGVDKALRADLDAKTQDRRTLAALSLLALEDWAGAARALGDDSPEVRRAVACQVLAEPDAGPQRPWSFLTPEFGAASSGVVPLLVAPTPG